MVYANPSAFYLGGGLPACHRYSNQVASVFAHQLHGVRLERFCPWQRMFFLYLHPLVPDGTEKDRVEIYRLLCGDRGYTATLYLPPPGHRNYFVDLHIVYPGDDTRGTLCLNLYRYNESQRIDCGYVLAKNTSEHLLMFLLMVTRIYGPILAILANLSSLLNLNVVTSRMRTLLTTPAMDGDGKTVPNCDIELSHVTFAYNQEDVIKDVSCKIPQGSVTALVGPSGSGKSTISKLIARFWDVQKGKITVGGKDIKSMEPESLMSYMSFVFQDVTLFNDTVMNNIRLGNPNATDDQVIAAAKAAYCDEFVREMPDGYQTVLGENGSTLSGGERQRISIARALLKNAPIILLDEATASLDPENEVLVQKAIAKLVEGKTVIMIAHRLRTVVDADQILVLDNGRLVEHGTHDELMKKNGLYHKLFHIQQESLGWAV